MRILASPHPDQGLTTATQWRSPAVASGQSAPQYMPQSLGQTGAGPRMIPRPRYELCPFQSL